MTDEWIPRGVKALERIASALEAATMLPPEPEPVVGCTHPIESRLMLGASTDKWQCECGFRGQGDD